MSRRTSLGAALILAALAAGTAACAQTTERTAAFDHTTGPTVPIAPSIADTRRLDANTAAPVSNNMSGQNQASDLGYGNWRTSSGFNSDPDNPNGAPGPSTVGTSPSR